MSGLLNRVFSSSSSSRPKYQSEAQPRSLDAPPPLPPASAWTRHQGPYHRRTVSFDAASTGSPKDDPRGELLVLRKENRRFKRKIEHLARQKDVYHHLLEKSGIEIPNVPETPAPHPDEADEFAVIAPIKHTATPDPEIPDPIPYWIKPSTPQSKLLQVLIAILLGRARTILRQSPIDHTKIEALATEALANAHHPSLKKDRALIAHCQFYLGLARFRQGRYPEAAEYLDGARAAVVSRYLKGELVDEWVERCRDAMEETQSPTRDNNYVPSERASQTQKRKGKETLHERTTPTANTTAVPLSLTGHLHQPNTPSAAVAPPHQHSSAALSETTIHPSSPTAPTSFPPSYLHSYANASSRSPSPRPLPADFPMLTLINSQGNSSATVRPISPNAFSPGGAFSSPPSSLEGTPKMAQGAFEPFVPTHRRGRSGGGGSDGAISSRLAFWENQRGDSGSDRAPAGGSYRQQRSTSPEEAEQQQQQQQQHQLPSVPEDEESDDDDDNSEDEQRRQFLDHPDTSSSSSNSSSSTSTSNDNQASPPAAPPPRTQDEVLAEYFTTRTPSHRSSNSDSASSSSLGTAAFSLLGSATRRRQRRQTDDSPVAGQGEVLANFFPSRANSIRSDNNNNNNNAPSPSPSSSSSRRMMRMIHQPTHSRTGSAAAARRRTSEAGVANADRAASTGGGIPARVRLSRTHSLISQVSVTGSLDSVPESDEEEEEERGGDGDAASRPMGEMIASKWKREVERGYGSPRGSRRASAAGVRVVGVAGSRRGSVGGSGDGNGSEKEGGDGSNGGGGAGARGKKRSRRERRALRAAAVGRS